MGEKTHLPVGLPVQGVVTEHLAFGIRLRLEQIGVQATVELRFMHDDPYFWADEPSWPKVGESVEGVVQGYSPTGQLEVSIRASDVRRA